MLHTGGMSALSFKTPTPFLRGRTYYFRLRVPQDLLPVYYPKKELTFSLKTRDFHQALENARLRAIQIDQEFREHRRRLAEQQAQALVPAVALAAPSPATAPLRPFAEMDEQEALYPDESLKAALKALNTPPTEDEAQAGAAGTHARAGRPVLHAERAAPVLPSQRPL